MTSFWARQGQEENRDDRDGREKRPLLRELRALHLRECTAAGGRVSGIHKNGGGEGKAVHELEGEEKMNKVILIGRLTKDPDIRQSQGAEPVTIARYTLAVDRRMKRQDGQQAADFISCVAFGKAGEFAEKYLHKGTKICVSGRIQTGSYTRQDGTKAYTTDVVIEEQEFAESKADSGRAAMDDQMAAMYAGQRSQEGQQDRTGQQGSWEQSAMDGFLNIPEGIDEELPFN